MEKLNKFSKRDIALIILALAVIVWGIYFYIQNRGGFSRENRYELTEVEGKLITGFPRQLIFENGVIPIESSRAMSDAQNLWSASYISAKTSMEIFSIYKNALEFIGWEITNSSAGTSIFAKKGGMQISVAIEDKSNRREVTLFVLER